MKKYFSEGLISSLYIVLLFFFFQQLHNDVVRVTDYIWHLALKPYHNDITGKYYS